MSRWKSERLLNRDFVLLWQGHLVSQLGNQAFLIATMSWTLETTGSPELMGLLLMTSTLPGVTFGPIAGALADRHSRRSLIVAADFLRGLGHLGLAALMLAAPSRTSVIVGGLLVLGFVSGLLGAVATPALAAAIPDLVAERRLAAANSLHHLSSQGAVLFGQAAGGLAYAWIGPGGLVLFDGITFLVSAGCARLARVPSPQAPAGHVRLRASAYLRDVRVGLAWLWRRPPLRSLTLTFATVNLLFTPVFVLLPVYVRDVLGRGAEWYGFLLAAAGGGAMTGAALMPLVLKARAILTPALLGIGLCTTALAACRSPIVALLLLATVGLLSGILNVRVMTTMQGCTPPEMRGRVLAVTMALASSAVPVGLALGGLAGGLARSALPSVIGACGVGILIVAARFRFGREL